MGVNVNYTLVDGVLTISGTIEHTTTSTSDWPWRNQRKNITSVIISDATIASGSNTYGMFDSFSNCVSIVFQNFNTTNSTDMGFMFSSCSSLASLDLSNFDTSNVTDMYYMFYSCSSLPSLDLSSFNTSNVTNMYGMFSNCSLLSSLDLSKFNTSEVTNMGHMFHECNSLTSLNLSNFNTSNVTSMSGMFNRCNSLTSLDLSSFNTSNVTSMSSMFSYCSLLTSLDLFNFNTSNVTIMETMFFRCSSLTSLDLSSFNTSNVTNMSNMFSYCSQLIRIYVDGNKWTTASISTDNGMFALCSSIIGEEGWTYNDSRPIYMSSAMAHIDDADGTRGYLSNGILATGTCRNVGWKIYKITGLLQINTNNASSFSNASSMIADQWGWHSYRSDIKNVEFINPVGCSGSAAYMFYHCSSLTSLDLSSFNTSNVTDMNSMFMNCPSLSSLDLSSFKTSNVTDMSFMFADCFSLPSLDLSNFNTSKVTNMTGMFNQCSSLTSLDLSNFNTSNFNTSNVTNMSFMFGGCSSLPSLDLSNFNTSKVTNMGNMFSGCGLLTSLDLSSFDTSKVTSMYYMFYNCSSLALLDLSGFEMSQNCGVIYPPCNCNIYINSTTSLETSALENNTYNYYIIMKGTRDETSINQWKTIANQYENVFFEGSGIPIKPTIVSVKRGECEYTLTEDSIQDATKKYYVLNGNTYKEATDFTNFPTNFYECLFSENDEGTDVEITFTNTVVSQNIPNNWTRTGTTRFKIYQDENVAIPDSSPTSPVYLSEVNANKHTYKLGAILEYADSYLNNNTTFTLDEVKGYSITLNPPFALLEFKNGGYGMSIGKLVVRNGLEISFPTAIGEGLEPSYIYNYSLTEDLTQDETKTYYILNGTSYQKATESTDFTNFPTDFYEQGERTNNVDLTKSQLIIGRYNEINDDVAFIIGNGTTAGSRSNALTVDWSGNVIAQGMAGMIQMFAGTTEPTGWLFCDGTTYNVSDYPELAAVLGSTYGGDGENTFAVPDMRGRFPLGSSSSHVLGSKGGSEYLQNHAHSGTYTRPTVSKSVSSADSITGGAHTNHTLNGYGATLGSGTTGWRFGSSGTKTATGIIEGGSHTHSVPQHAHTLTGGGYTVNGVQTTGHAAMTTGNAGNMPPFLTINYIIATGKTS